MPILVLICESEEEEKIVLTEREYRIACINERFSVLKGRRTVIYGTGINAKLIIDHAGDVIDIVGLMDESQSGRTLYGYTVLSREEVAALNVDVIVIAAQIDSAIKVYGRIHEFCKEHNLEMIDLYGNRINEIRRSVFDMGSERKDISLLSNEEVKKIVDSTDVISIDLKVLFSKSQTESELFQRVWERKFHHGTNAFIELRKKIGDQQEKSYGNIYSIYDVLKSYLCLSENDKNALMRTELDLRKQYIEINASIAELIGYVQNQGKKLFLINESALPGSFWISVIEDQRIKTKQLTLLNRSESTHNKFTGLYREILEYEPNKEYVHIGDDYYADGIAAAVYGFQSIVIKKASEVSIVETYGVRNCALLDCIHEYCTDNVKYENFDDKYSGFIKLKVNSKYYAIISEAVSIKPGWLEQLVSTVEAEREISIVCSRVSRDDATVLYAGELVKENMLVQKAQMVSGYLPMYDYVRYANQISLVSFLVRKNEWDEAETVSSELLKVLYAYLKEDGKVLYQPLSEVTCVCSDLNIDAFVIDCDAIERSKILVTDNLLTRFDRDAGSRCTWFYMKQFQKLGFDVTLMAQNFDEIQPYVMLIQQAGIRVIYGNYYRLHWKTWLKEENGSFKYVYMQRPGSTAFFLEEIRKTCVSAKIFYFAHDLHFLRLLREYEITGNPGHLKESQTSKEQECSLIEAADVVHVVGSYEQNYLRKMYPEKKIRNIPLYIYEEMPERQVDCYDMHNRKDLLYVGSFGHPPNLDAVVWFAKQILPRVLDHYPRMVWHVVGANPPVEVQKYQGENLTLHGFLSDDELKKLYHTCRIVVVPLRYGAGVKGKILEASFYQVPIITTPIGAEGIPQDENNMIVCETANAFANAVCDLYTDEARLCSMSEGGRRLINKYYTEAAVNQVLSLDMPELQLS